MFYFIAENCSWSFQIAPCSGNLCEPGATFTKKIAPGSHVLISRFVTNITKFWTDPLISKISLENIVKKIKLFDAQRKNCQVHFDNKINWSEYIRSSCIPDWHLIPVFPWNHLPLSDWHSKGSMIPLAPFPDKWAMINELILTIFMRMSSADD